MMTPSISKPPKLLTTTVIADRLGVSVKRVEYVLRTRRYIHPSAYAGNVRLFDEGGLALIRMELDAIDEQNRRRRGGAR